jgi:ubiquinone/menaquinone biosynthesis C-methylase UbiE
MKQDSTIENNWSVHDYDRPDIAFEKKYIELRQKEQRVYSDEELLQLPIIPKEHPHYAEWQIRKRSCNRLVHHLQKKHSLLRILEIGCGNGWMAHQLALTPGCTVTATDINFTELQQGARVFSHIANLQFIYCDIHSDILSKMQFDCIVFAACIQYFPSIPEVIQLSLPRLRPGGEIHILDSPFYKPVAIEAAQRRTHEYYCDMGFPEMSEHYYHHALSELDEFGYETLYHPSSFQHYLMQNKNPFPWLLVRRVTAGKVKQSENSSRGDSPK